MRLNIADRNQSVIPISITNHKIPPNLRSMLHVTSVEFKVTGEDCRISKKVKCFRCHQIESNMSKRNCRHLARTMNTEMNTHIPLTNRQIA